MAYDIGFSQDLARRMEKAGDGYSLFVDADTMDRGESIDLLYDVLKEVYTYVRDGDFINIWDTMDSGEPAFEYDLEVSDKYVGEFEFRGHRLRGTVEEEEGEMPWVNITIAGKDGGEKAVCTLYWVTIAKEAEILIAHGLEKALA